MTPDRISALEQHARDLQEVADSLLCLVGDLVAVIPGVGVQPSAASRLDAIGRRAEHLRASLRGR